MQHFLCFSTNYNLFIEIMMFWNYIYSTWMIIKKGYIKGWTVCILRRGWGGRVEHHEFFTSSLAFSNTIGAWKNAQQCLLCVHIFPPLEVEKYFSSSRGGKICTHSKGHAACIFAQLWRKPSLQLRNIRKNAFPKLAKYFLS